MTKSKDAEHINFNNLYFEIVENVNISNSEKIMLSQDAVQAYIARTELHVVNNKHDKQFSMFPAS